MVKPILYYALYSPPARAALLTVKILNLDFDLRSLDFSKKEQLSEEFMKINPQHTVPTLVADGIAIWDSHAIIAYLVSKYGTDDSLYPKNLLIRAQIDQRMYFDATILFNVIRSFYNSIVLDGKTEFQKESIQMAHEAYDLMEQFLINDFLVGNILTIADISCISDLNTIEQFVSIDNEKYPKLSAWFNRMTEIPGYKLINDEGVKLMPALLNQCMQLNRANNLNK